MARAHGPVVRGASLLGHRKRGMASQTAGISTARSSTASRDNSRWVLPTIQILTLATTGTAPTPTLAT